jgi:hypothetical protein
MWTSLAHVFDFANRNPSLCLKDKIRLDIVFEIRVCSVDSAF